MGSEWREEIEPGVGILSLLKTLTKALLELPVIAFLVLAATMGFWLPVAAYLLLRTWLLGMGPLYMWAVLGIGLLLFLYGLGDFVGWSIKLTPYARELRAAKRSGKNVRIDLALDAWRVWNRRRRFGPLWMAMLSLFIILPAWVALAWASHPAAQAGDATKPHEATRDEQVRALITRMGEKGFVPAGNRRP